MVPPQEDTPSRGGQINQAIDDLFRGVTSVDIIPQEDQAVITFWSDPGEEVLELFQTAVDIPDCKDPHNPVITIEPRGGKGVLKEERRFRFPQGA
jgi:hypothetical protein